MSFNMHLLLHQCHTLISIQERVGITRIIYPSHTILVHRIQQSMLLGQTTNLMLNVRQSFHQAFSALQLKSPHGRWFQSVLSLMDGFKTFGKPLLLVYFVTHVVVDHALEHFL